MTELERLAGEFANKDWPRKGEWDKPARYDTLMQYEVNSYVADAYEAGFRKAREMAVKASCCDHEPCVTKIERLGESEAAE